MKDCHCIAQIYLGFKFQDLPSSDKSAYSYSFDEGEQAIEQKRIQRNQEALRRRELPDYKAIQSILDKHPNAQVYPRYILWFVVIVNKSPKRIPELDDGRPRYVD